MLLADTSVWIDHIRNRDLQLSHLLEEGEVYTHPFIIGEVALGNWKYRSDWLEALSDLPRAPVAGSEEVLALIERRNLMGCGIGWVDAHLLASLLISDDGVLLTHDKKLHKVALSLGLASPLH